MLAPEQAARGRVGSSLEASSDPEVVRREVRVRAASYDDGDRVKANELQRRMEDCFEPLIERLAATACMKLISWERAIEAIGAMDAGTADELRAFYRQCLRYRTGRVAI